jgi:hypothetical protein
MAWVLVAGAAMLTNAARAVDPPQTPPPIPSAVKRVAPDRLANYWLLDPASAEASVPNSGYGLDAPTCAAVSYLIDNNGRTSRVKLERAVPPGALGKVAVNVVAGMRFVATKENAAREPVYTYVVIPFNLPQASSTKPADKALRARVLDPCNLPDFLASGR